jgi:predicted amidohydrolase
VVIPQAGALDEWPDGLFQAEVRTAAFQNGYFTALANRVGIEDNIIFAGESFVCGPDGDIIASAPKIKDHILYAEIDTKRIEDCHARRHFFQDRRPDTYHLLVGQNL